MPSAIANPDHRARGRQALLAALLATALIATWAALASPAAATNHSYPATYSGTAATGGTVEFDVSADGINVTRFAVVGVPTTCGTITATASGAFPILANSFSNGSPTATGLRFSGSFPAAQQAQGGLSIRLVGFPSCTSADVSWTARTSVPPPDTKAPQTKIRSGPKGTTTSKKAKFKFSSSESGSKFQCRLDRKAWQSCRSPRTYKNLKKGQHTFRVRARDKAGNVDATPAKRTWSVKPQG
jgi:hypothetical protein